MTRNPSVDLPYPALKPVAEVHGSRTHRRHIAMPPNGFEVRYGCVRERPWRAVDSVFLTGKSTTVHRMPWLSTGLAVSVAVNRPTRMGQEE